MRDVAALADVSLKTVSRVVNGTTTVDPELAARVNRAVAQLDYRPNLTASNLRRTDGKTATVGLLLEDVSNPFSSALHRAVEDVAAARGVGVLGASLDEDPLREREFVMSLIARRVDGFIIVPAGDDHSYLLNEKRAGTAFVFADRPPMLLAADSVVSDNGEGASGAVTHLLAHGHRRIGFLGDLNTISTARERFGGYCDTLRAAGVPIEESLVVHDLHTAEATEHAVMQLLSQPEPPTAIFASQNLVTIGTIRALRKLGLAHGVALVGFDDFLMADLLEPGVTVVAQDATEMGRIAADSLFRRLDGDASPPMRHVVKTRLITRGSGEIPPS
jgi:LacI family transcriptional regulator